MKRQTTTLRTCPACGAAVESERAPVCLVCGKLLAEDYQPLDTIRSSYRLQRVALTTGRATDEPVNLFVADEKNAAAQVAWASFVYSLVPYLGVLFIPFTIMVSAAGIIKARRDPQIGGGNVATRSLLLSFPVLVVQLVLWWLLYYIPELAR
jgi:hypothetical protein